MKSDNGADRAGRPLFSVCIANYNGEALIGPCLDSVRGQVGAPALEIIVHDDASTDGSAQMLAQQPDVVLIRSDTNVGFCVANNRMAARARGDILLLLNNDAELHPDALATLAGLMFTDPAVGIATVPQFDADGGGLLDQGMRLDPFLNPVPVLAPLPGPPQLGMVCGSCLAVRRSLWDLARGLPEFFGSIAEDMYLCLFARAVDSRIVCTSGSGYRHHVGASFGGGKAAPTGLSSTYRRRAMSERNKTCNMIIFYPVAALLPLLPLHLLLLLLEGLVMCLAKLQLQPLRRIYVPAVLGVAAEAPRLLQLRRHVGRQRTVPLARFFAGFSAWPHKLTLLSRHGIPHLR